MAMRRSRALLALALMLAATCAEAGSTTKPTHTKSTKPTKARPVPAKKGSRHSPQPAPKRKQCRHPPPHRPLFTAKSKAARPPKPKPRGRPPPQRPCSPPPQKPRSRPPSSPPPSPPLLPPPPPAGPLALSSPATCTVDINATDFVSSYPSARLAATAGGVLAVTLSPGEWGSRGGVQASIAGACVNATEALACYDVRFGNESQFQFVKGGKAGLGFQFGPGQIQGGEWAPTAGSARVMFRRQGGESGYLYWGSSTQGSMGEQLPGYADVARPAGGGGHSLWEQGKSADPLPAFVPGAWQRVCVLGRLNSNATSYDGVIGVSVDGAVREYRRLRWLDDRAGLSLVEFSAWFGGSDASWTPTRPMTIYFRNMTVEAVA